MWNSNQGFAFINGVIVIMTTFDLARSDLHPNKAALVIIDMQDCFVPGGSLAVTGGNDIVPVINSIRAKNKDDFSLVVLSQDWHPAGHVSFASSHSGVQSPMSLEYSSNGSLCEGANIDAARFPDAVSCMDGSATKTLQQTLWPDHCIQNVRSGPTSAGFVPGLKVDGDLDLIIQKGTNLQVDSYSAFFDNGGFGETRLDNELRARGITHVFVTGLAADYCVYFTSLDAQKLGYDTYYVIDATKPVAEDTYRAALDQLAKDGVHLISADTIPQILEEIHQQNASSRPSCLSLMATIATILLVNKLM